METLLREEELKRRLTFYYNSLVANDSKEKRLLNIVNFCNIDRSNLEYGITEKKLLLYKTVLDERIFIQYPGKESVIEKFPKPYDFRPELYTKNGARLKPASFYDIWDVLEYISKSYPDYLPMIASIFIRISYMYGYQIEKNSYLCATIEDSNTIIDVSKEELEWYRIGVDNVVWDCFNKEIGLIPMCESEISIEAFFKYIDLLFQNEDCKYYYIKTREGKSYSLNCGRNSSCDTNLSLISYLKNDFKMSELLRAMSSGRGVAKFRVSDYEKVTDGIVKIQ